MKFGIIGSRSFNDYDLLSNTLKQYHNSIECIVSGGAVGADTLAEKYANEHNIPTLIFKPQYSIFGKIAPLLRNKTIVEKSDVIIAFWDGKSTGTLNSINHCKKMRKKLILINI